MLTTPRALADACRAALPAERPAEAPRRTLRERLPAVPRPVRVVTPYVLSAALLLVIGLVFYGLGSSVGTLRAEDDPLQAIVSTNTSPGASAPARSAVVDLSREAVVDDYDPEGDGAESDGEVPNAYDGDAATAWNTVGYRTASFGGLKSGVGLLVDLKAPTSLARVEVDASAAGATFELRAADALGDDASALPVVATGGGRQPRLVPKAGTRARYWLVWVTALPQEGRSFRVGVDEMRFVRG